MGLDKSILLSGFLFSHALDGVMLYLSLPVSLVPCAFAAVLIAAKNNKTPTFAMQCGIFSDILQLKKIII
jgi:hypothetical protein